MKIWELKAKFYEIVESKGQANLQSPFQANEIFAQICAPMSPDRYDAILEARIKQHLPRIKDQEFIDWVDEILAAIEENRGNDHDLRGMKKNRHEFSNR